MTRVRPTGKAATLRNRRTALTGATGLAALAGVAGSATGAAAGQSLYQAQQFLLGGDTTTQLACVQLVGDDPRDPADVPLGFGPHLAGVCGQLVPPSTGFVNGAAGGPGAPIGGEPTGTSARLQAIRDAATDDPAADQPAAGDLAAAQATVTALSLGQGLELWLSAGGSSASHSANRFEDGYDAAQPIVTAGADYRFTSWMTAGLAFTYNGSFGSFDDGGHFSSNAFGPILYASLTPLEGAFADVALSYSRQQIFRTRKATWINEADDLFEGRVSADYPADIYGASVLVGYDQPFGRFTLGPRLGFNASYSDIGNFEEQGNTGLELQLSGLDRTSVQSTFGLNAQAAYSLSVGVLVPQLAATWVHEYGLGNRTATMQFAQDLRPSPTRYDFTYYEAPDRDYTLIAAGLTARLPNGVQPFVNFTTLQGNDNLTTYGASAGVRLSLQ